MKKGESRNQAYGASPKDKSLWKYVIGYKKIVTQSSHCVDRAGWWVKMAAIDLWIAWRNAYMPQWQHVSNSEGLSNKWGLCTYVIVHILPSSPVIYRGYSLGGGGNLHYQMHHHHEVVLVGTSVGLPPSPQKPLGSCSLLTGARQAE